MQLPASVVDRLRNAVFWTPGLTITGLVESCIKQAIERLEHERGEIFPERAGELKAGRPPK